ncbi:MAG: DUF2283 domain-containing protein [archaeon]
MENENVKVSYDAENDMFSIFKKGHKSKFSIDISLPKGDIIIDVGFNGQIVGLEFFNASDYIPLLKNIGDEKVNAKMSVQYGKDWAEIYYEISIPGKPIVSNRIISPYNKQLILEN